MIKISPAKKEDISKVIEIFKRLSFTKNKSWPKRDLSKKGFLFYPINSQMLEKAIKEKEIFLVAKEENKILGYLLAYDFSKWLRKNKSWMEKIKIKGKSKRIFEKRIIYFKHVGVISQKRSIGLKLEKELFSIAKKKKYDLILAEIATKPRNSLSKKVHKKRGFFKIGKIKYSDKTYWGIYIKNL